MKIKSLLKSFVCIMMFAQISHMTSAQALMDDAKIFEMYAKCHKNSDENFIFSPFSVAQLLKMLSIGADEDGKAEIARLLKVSRDEVSSVLKASENEEALFCANSIWLQEGKVLPQNFCGILKADCGADVLNADFAKSADVRKKISYWAAQKTMNLMNDVDIKLSDTGALIINVAAFRKEWKFPFNPQMTSLGYFNNGNATRGDAYYMKQNIQKLACVKEEDCEAIELPYYGDKYSIIFIKTINGMSPSEITFKIYSYICKTLQEPSNMHEVNINLPKFSIRGNSLSIIPLLQEMGVKKVFETDRLDALCKLDALFSAVKIDINPSGTNRESPNKRIFNALRDKDFYIFNSPFMFFLRENDGGNILFMGVVNDPLKN